MFYDIKQMSRELGIKNIPAIRIHTYQSPYRGAYSYQDNTVHLWPAADIITVYHELVHCKQYESGKLRIDKAGVRVWRGKYSTPCVGHYEYMDYYNKPWERQARLVAAKLSKGVVRG